MASRPSLVTPSGRFEMQWSGNFPQCRYQGYRTSRTPRDTSRCQRCRNCCQTGDEVDVDLHTDTNNFSPNEYRGVVNSSGLAVYKGSTQEIITSTESKD